MVPLHADFLSTKISSYTVYHQDYVNAMHLWAKPNYASVSRAPRGITGLQSTQTIEKKEL